MFNNEEREMLQEELEDQMIMDDQEAAVAELAEKYRKKNIVNPIIFTSNGELCRNNMLHDLPINLFAKSNFQTIINADAAIGNLSPVDLYLLDNNSRNIYIRMLNEYILQESFLNFCNVINSSELAPYLAYIPIKAKVKERLDTNIAVENILVSFFMSSNSDFSSHRDSEQDMNRTMELSMQISLQITHSVIMYICMGIDEAINDIILQVHLIPNIENLYDKILKDRNFASYRKQSKDNNQDLIALYLKTIARNDITNILFPIIGRSVTNVLQSSIGAGYYAYHDFAEYQLNNKNNDKL